MSALRDLAESLHPDHPAQAEYRAMFALSQTVETEIEMRKSAQRDYRALCDLLEGKEVSPCSLHVRLKASELRDKILGR